ncbi:hypothetical protein Taro_022867 [Colocasia esculenta]|uniref:PDZ domain-containing protein n=1 Tax=Colocasia esculenta TaxID=4460 RepID=A0A843V325_COLES|nr:hypothetical protein [Colocasia esculenta]
MVAANLKAETIALMDQRASVEAQMNAIIARLCQPGGPGITGNLLDAEGFPRADIDVPAVRSDRGRLAELRNDYKDITNKIDQNLQVLHSAKLGQSGSTPPRDSDVKQASTNSFHACTDAVTSTSTPAASISVMDEDPHVGAPFAMVDEITEESPAAEDGLQLGDLIVKFGSVVIGGELLPRLASEAQLNNGKPVSVTVIRQGSPMSLIVTPRQWHGRGLLGCHFRIL